MKTQFLKKCVEKPIVLTIAIGLAVLSFGCGQPAPTTNANVNTNTAVVNAAPVNSIAANSSPAPSPNKESQAKMPVTLPVLDAMFSDETFAGELKSKVQLTDEQVERLKNLSREAVANLSESEANNSGSTRAATERADKQIREILGDEKASKLFEFVGERGSEKGDQTNVSSQPNAVPNDTRIVVNTPAYRMDIFQDGKLVKSYKIGIGYPEFPLPSGLRKAKTIIFNPTWTPPDEPWVKGKVQPYKKIEAGDKLNPLGPIKIPIGSPSLIHGGKQAAKLGGFASHGCVGLTNPQVQDFAVELAKISGMSLTILDVKNYEKQKTETKNVPLTKEIPVELRYETIVVEAGKLKIYRDVYEKGTNTEENLRRVLQVYGVSLDSIPAQDRDKILQGLSQMAIDATGNPIEVNTNGNKNKTNSSKESKNGSVTRNIKGLKEVSFDVAGLQGKGYPAALGIK